MTQKEFTERFRHEVEGWLLDAAMSGRSGAELSIWLRHMRARIETKLGQMWQDMQSKAPGSGAPAGNGSGAAPLARRA